MNKAHQILAMTLLGYARVSVNIGGKSAYRLLHLRAKGASVGDCGAS